MKKYSMLIADLILKRFIFENFLSNTQCYYRFHLKYYNFNKTLLYKHKYLEMSKLKKA